MCRIVCQKKIYDPYTENKQDMLNKEKRFEDYSLEQNSFQKARRPLVEWLIENKIYPSDDSLKLMGLDFPEI